MSLHALSLFIHIAAGSLALITFWTAGLMKKGTPVHRRVGQIYLLAMVAVIVTGIPLVLSLIERGQQVGALFLTYLLVLVGNSTWSSWRAVRDRTDRAAYFGGMHWFIVGLTAVTGMMMIALGVQVGSPLLQVFGGVGVIGGIVSWRSWKRAPSDPKWWLKEHYSAMIGNGVATHIAFFAIGLRNALPFLDPQVQQMLAWFTPLAGSLIASWWLNRKYAAQGRASGATAGAGVAPGKAPTRVARQTSPSVNQPSPLPH